MGSTIIRPVEAPGLTYTTGRPAEIDSPLYRRPGRLVKRASDILLSSLLVIPVMLLFPFIVLLICIESRGPVLFLQQRHKRNGRLFTCLKFRTMHAEKHAGHSSGASHRITRSGRLLRKYHLDELPQLFNVWWGDMSIIGPRPHMISDNEQFDRLVDNYAIRNSVKPGITGLAQVRGHIGPVRTVNDIRRRVENDIHYIRHWSPALDIRIFFLSFFRIREGDSTVIKMPER